MLTCYSVVCRSIKGKKDAWSLTQAASNPAEAIARTCLPPAKREAFVVQHWQTPAPLVVMHPGANMAQFEVIAEEMK
jgi:hypothetical protein